MLQRLSATILGAMVVLSLAAAQHANARAKRVKPLDNSIVNVKTRIVPNWQNSGQDVCFVHNSNGRRVVAYVNAFPAGLFQTSKETATIGPIFMAPIDDQKVFSWWGKRPAPPKCWVKSSQYQ